MPTTKTTAKTNPKTKTTPVNSRPRTAKVFQCGNSQAIRIPSEFHTEITEFTICRLGDDGFCLYPAKDQWYLLKQCVKQLKQEPDFARNQPQLSDLPEREQL